MAAIGMGRYGDLNLTFKDGDEARTSEPLAPEGVWQDFEYLLEGEEVCIRSYLGQMPRVEIPDLICGVPVTKVGDRAFLDKRFIEEVEIGRNVTVLGRNCFYDCRKLRHLELTDHVRDMGDGAFKNCESLSSITLYSREERDSCIRAILEECWQEIQVRIVYDKEEARLIFPEYEIEYFENCSTVPHLFYTEIYGSGQAFRQCLQGTRISYRDYDLLLEKSSRDDRGPVAAGIAMNRLKYPLNLTSERREACRKHLRSHGAEAIRWLIEQDWVEEITFLTDLGIFNEENLPECLRVAEEEAEPVLVAALLAQTMKNSQPAASPRRRYEL